MQGFLWSTVGFLSMRAWLPSGWSDWNRLRIFLVDAGLQLNWHNCCLFNEKACCGWRSKYMVLGAALGSFHRMLGTTRNEICETKTKAAFHFKASENKTLRVSCTFFAVFVMPMCTTDPCQQFKRQPLSKCGEMIGVSEKSWHQFWKPRTSNARTLMTRSEKRSPRDNSTSFWYMFHSLPCSLKSTSYKNPEGVVVTIDWSMTDASRNP